MFNLWLDYPSIDEEIQVIKSTTSDYNPTLNKALSKDDLLKLLEMARKHLEKQLNIDIAITEYEALIRISGGDARKLLNALELVVTSEQDKKKVIVTNDKALKVIQENLALYDKGGEMHYDVISAFIKSMRGSDPNAAVYWLARMIEGGEDPKFIARRMVILASEDIGNANPNALLLANACFEAINKIGWPEGRIILSQTAIYLATSPKSNAAYEAINAAQAEVRQSGNLAVPLHIRNAPTKLMKEIGYGKNYKYAHSYKGNFADQEFLPEKISGKKFFEPGDNKRENELRAWLKARWGEKYKY
jgi:putative ATPase